MILFFSNLIDESVVIVVLEYWDGIIVRVVIDVLGW